MYQVSLRVNKEEVYEEVAQTTSYTGAKMEGGNDATYERIFTTEADRSQLERFWNESCVAVCEAMKEFIVEERYEDGRFIIFLSLSSSFEPSLQEPMNKELFSFFVTSIICKWYVFTNKQEAGEYASSAAAMLEGVKRKAYFRRRPTKPKRITF